MSPRASTFLPQFLAIPSISTTSIMLRRILPFLFGSFAFCAFAADQLPPSKDSARGDALEAAIKANDVEKLKSLLRPEDRNDGASYTTTEDAKLGRTRAMCNLLGQATANHAPACFIALLEYGIDIYPWVLDREAKHLDTIKAHYPDFTNKLGRPGMVYAASTGQNELLKKLLAAGVTPTASDLAQAVKRSNPGAVKILLAAGVSKDATAEYQDRQMSMKEIARTGMFFSVLEALGAWEEYAPELQKHRKNRPGAGADAFFGHWRFQEASMGLILQPDGSGFFGSDFNPETPILWKVDTEGEGKAIKVEWVRTFQKGDRPPGPFLFPISGMSLYCLDGLQTTRAIPGRRDTLTEDQLQAITTLNKQVPYNGPVGEWIMEFDPAGIHPEFVEEARKSSKDMKLVITKDGHATLTAPPTRNATQTMNARLFPGSTPNELQMITTEGRASVMKTQDKWKTLQIRVPGLPYFMKLTRKKP